MIEYFGGVTGVSTRYHGQRMTANGGDAGDVAREPAGTAGVAGVEHQNAGWKGIAGVFASRWEKGSGGVWHPGDWGSAKAAAQVYH